MTHADDWVTIDELTTVLGIPEDECIHLTAGAFEPSPDGQLRLRAALGVAVLACFAATGALPADMAAQVAVEAATGANMTGKPKYLLVASHGTKPTWAWFDGPATAPSLNSAEGCPSPLRRPMVLVSVDEMLTDLAAGIESLRGRKGAALH